MVQGLSSLPSKLPLFFGFEEKLELKDSGTGVCTVAGRSES